STPSPGSHTLSLHDALPISLRQPPVPARNLRVFAEPCIVRRQRSGLARKELRRGPRFESAPIEKVLSIQRREQARFAFRFEPVRSEEHTSELQSRSDLVCRL